VTRHGATIPWTERSPAPAAPPSSLYGLHWVYAFVAFELLCTLALIVPGIDAIRPACRVAVFGASLGMLLVIPRGASLHPAIGPAIAVMLILALGIFHPESNSPLASLATIAMYAAVLAPIMWVSGLHVDVNLLRRVAMILWSYHTLGAIVGVAQMYLPDALQPEPSAVFLERGEAMVEGAKITLSGGQRVFRPMGLTDLPGGAANSGLASIVFGVGIALADRRRWLRIACAAGMCSGFFVIYLSQVRSILVMAIISLIVFAIILWRRRDLRRLGHYLLLIGIVLLASTAWALVIGGEATLARLRTLVEHDPATVYYYNRGHYLHHTWDVLVPRYPLGAGLGRWGMIHHYFGESARGREPLWAEIQTTAWLYDGGVPLILAYASAVLAAVWISWKIATHPRGGGALPLWASMLCASNVAALAVTFNYPIFMSQGGMEFWLLNACLWGAWVNRARSNRVAKLGGVAT
jgi:hypothetical protein